MSLLLTEQIEAAFQYRGDVTIVLRSGESIVGYLYNREPGKFVDVFRASDGQACRFDWAEIQSIACTGIDHAAGKSYQEWLAQKKGQGAA